jgi:7,8-dihydro-6-hydroxymethylpterin-pyrophosphokinase
MAQRQAGRKTYKSMQGKTIDMDLLRKKNELTPAVGNARVNARGDELGPGGKIVKKREDVVKEYYNSRPVEQVQDRPIQNTVVEQEAPKKSTPKKTTTRAQQKVQKAAEPTAAELAEFDDMDDGWVEDADGNFVKKGE